MGAGAPVPKPLAAVYAAVRDEQRLELEPKLPIAPAITAARD
jgi:hypothetical protein